MYEPLDEVAAKIALLALRDVPGIGRVGAGPVLTVVRDTTSGKLYVGLNTGIPKNVSDVLSKSIEAQRERIARGEVIVVRTDPQAVGGHSEVTALNPAILNREKMLGRKLTERDLNVFELHNVWLTGDRKKTAAPRCEHCARITRGVLVTQSIFVAEGGVVGEINVPQRGLVIPPGSRGGNPVTTASGEINVPQRGSVTPAGGGASRPATTTGGGINVPQRGSVTPAGGGASRPATTTSGEISVPQRGSVTPAGGGASRPATTTSGSIGAPGGGVVGPAAGVLVASAFALTVPAIKEWFSKNYLQEKWTAAARAMVMDAIVGSSYLYNCLIISHMQDIQKEKTAGRQVKLRIDVDTQSVATDMGMAQTKAFVSYYTIVFERSIEMDWPVFQNNLIVGPKIVNRRATYYIVL